MRVKILSTGLKANLTVLIATLFVTVTCASAQDRVLHSFNYTNGANSLAGLISDASGNFYGTTLYGGTDGDGTVFKLSPEATGTVLYSFNSPGADGHWPIAGLNFDASGNLFGTTEMGGTEGYGAVFELTPAASGGWTERVLHSFNNNGQDGTYPRAGLIVDASGHLYGTTTGGGTDDYGMVFELTQAGGGVWTEKVLHSFNNADGGDPSASLIFDAAGNLYGTTFYGGAYSNGTVFELTPNRVGGWTEKVLHSFNNPDGANPAASLIFDAAGNLYGMTSAGGAHGKNGAVFELTPAAGTWTETILHSFDDNHRDGHNPFAALIFDAVGNLYGTTPTGGAYDWGTAFELVPSAGGGWTEKILHNFSPTDGDGFDPVSALIFDASGHLYGTTYYGGAYGNGTVFEITP